MRAYLALAVAIRLGPARLLVAQEPAIESLTLDIGLDTTAAPLGEIVRTLDAYLHLPAPGYTATDLWTREDRPPAGAYDLTARLAYQGFRAQVMEISPTYEADSAFVIKTAYYSSDSTIPSRLIALQRLYARPELGRWVLSPALPRLTKDWSTTPIGPLNYHYPAGHPFDRGAAFRAAKFVDSLASALHVHSPQRIDYYLGSSTEEVYRIVGLDYFISPSGPTAGRGGYAMTAEGVVLAGNPLLGPAYTHELVHIVLRGLPARAGRLYVMEEGAATWLGGSGGKPFTDLLTQLQLYQHDHPSVTVWELLKGQVTTGWGPPETQALYATAALIVDTVYQRGGTARLRDALLLPASTSLEDTFLPVFVGVSTGDMDAWWHSFPSVRSGQLRNN